MESHRRVELPLWRWQAVKRKIRKTAKSLGDKAVRLGSLQLPGGLESKRRILAQAEGFRRRVPTLLRLQADLLAMWVWLCEVTGREQIRRGIRDLSERLVASSERYSLPRWAYPDSQGIGYYCGSRDPGSRSTEELLVEGIRTRRSPAVPVEEAEKAIEEMLSLFLARPECRVRVFTPEEEEGFQRAWAEQRSRAVEARTALEEAWDEPLAIDLPLWLARFLDIDNDPKIRIRGKVERKGKTAEAYLDEGLFLESESEGDLVLINEPWFPRRGEVVDDHG